MRQHDASGRVETQIQDFEIDENVFGPVVAEASVIDAGGVVNDDFRDAGFCDGGYESEGERVLVSDVGWVGVDGCGGAGGSDEGCVTFEVGGGVGEEGDVGEAVCDEVTGGVGADHGAGADDEDCPSG